MLVYYLLNGGNMKYLDNLEDIKQKYEEKNKIEFETQRKRTQEIEEVTKIINMMILLVKIS